MREYGKVHTTFWSSPTIRALSEDGRTLAFYLLTSPHSTSAGVFRLPDGYVCEDLQWSSERVSEGFRELFAKGFANRCGTTKWVWIVKHFDWNPPENPNQRKAAAKIAQSIPDECAWKPDFMRVYGDFLGIEWSKNANRSATVPKPFANQEQEQEQEQEKDIGGHPAAAPQLPLPGDPPPPADLASRKAQRLQQVAEDAREAYNRILAKPHGLLTACTVLNKPRLKAVEKALPTARAICRQLSGDDRVTPEFWNALFEAAAKDDFLAGRGPYRPPHENWRPDFEYLLRESVIAKLFDREMTEDAA